ncbi:MAG: hypothetical protein II992_07760 [Lachnospiraceae bacterium]|nr:hypothetical protein [Lachnospiraceae bacterium]
MNWKSKISMILFGVLGAGIGLALIAGYNIKMAKKYGIIEEEKDNIIFSDSMNEEAFDQMNLQTVKVRSKITEKDTVIELVERLSGTQWDSTYESKIDTGTYYQDDKNGIVVNYQNESDVASWVYVNTNYQNTSERIEESEDELKEKVESILKELDFDMRKEPTVKKDDEQMPTEITLTYEGMIEDRSIIGGYNDVRFGVTFTYTKLGISTISVTGFQVESMAECKVDKGMQTDAVKALKTYIKEKDTLADWKEYAVISEEVEYLPCRMDKKDGKSFTLLPLLTFKTRVTQYDYEKRECKVYVEYAVYNWKRDVIEYVYQ